MRLHLVLLMLGCFLVNSARGEGVPDKAFLADASTLFLCHFDQGLEADVAAGKKEVLSGKAGLAAQGYFGSAYLGGWDPGIVLRYSAVNNINPAQGTIEFWYRPNFNLNSPQVPISIYRLFVSIDPVRKAGTGIGLNYYSKENMYQLWFYAWGEKQDPACYGVDKITEFKKNDWYHIAACWDEKKMMLFLNGKCLGVKERKVTMTFGDTFQLGGDPANAGYADGLIDEFRISDQVRYQAPAGTVQMEFPENRGSGTVLGYHDTAQTVLFRVEADCPVRITLRPQNFPVVAGEEYYIASSYDDPLVIKAFRDGELTFDLSGPRNATIVIERPSSQNLLPNCSFESVISESAAGWTGAAGEKKTPL